MTIATKSIAMQGGSLEIQIRQGEPTAPVLIFPHYWGGSHRTWAPIIEHLTSPGPMVTYDHRGWGHPLEIPALLAARIDHFRGRLFHSGAVQS